VTKPSLVVVLAEDQRHQRLIRKYLHKLRYENHDIRYLALPSGRGCGEQWVRKHYIDEVKNYRSRSARAQSALIVAIDADTGDVKQRVRQLNEALHQAGLAERADKEAIVLLIPKRNVETWILCLNGEQVDETTDYSNRPEIDSLIEPASAVFYGWSRPKAILPAHCVPSLTAAMPEIRRLE
jgi:hypothetical protein